MRFIGRAFFNFLRIYFYIIVAFGAIWLVGLASDRAIQTLAQNLHLSFLLGIVAMGIAGVVTYLEHRQFRFARIAASGDPQQGGMRRRS